MGLRTALGVGFSVGFASGILCTLSLQWFDGYRKKKAAVAQERAAENSSYFQGISDGSWYKIISEYRPSWL